MDLCPHHLPNSPGHDVERIVHGDGFSGNISGSSPPYASYPSSMSAAWFLAGSGLKGGAGELAAPPTEVKEVLTLLVKSKTRRKADSHTTVESQRDQVYAFGE